jgi:hypothetical protein
MCVVLITMLVAPAVVAQEKSTALTLAQIQAERRAIIEATVAPSPLQAEEFWQTYWEYRGHVGVLTDRTVAVIEEYKESYAALNDDQAARLVNEVLDIEEKRAELKQEYVKKFKQILIPKQVVRWYQTETKMDALMRAEMAITIPFDR